MPGVRVVELEETDSTNSYALEAMRDGRLTPPGLVVAQRQTAGRGQHGRCWITPPGGIAMTAVLSGRPIEEPPLPPGLVAASAGLAVGRAVAHWVDSADVAIKWPNDIWVRARKVAGILIESCVRDGLWVYVIGIGINANGSAADLGLAGDSTGGAVFLEEIRERPVDRDALTIQVMQLLMREFPRCDSDAARVADDFNRLHHFHNRWLTIAGLEGTQSGWCRGLNSSGELILETMHGLVPIINGSIA